MAIVADLLVVSEEVSFNLISDITLPKLANRYHSPCFDDSQNTRLVTSGTSVTAEIQQYSSFSGSGNSPSA
jgi:hypothetical protein